MNWIDTDIAIPKQKNYMPIGILNIFKHLLTLIYLGNITL